MADEDEIDILGDYSLDGFLLRNNEISGLDTGTELLRCDYTVHPQWLLDTEKTACWYNEEAQITEKLRSISPPTVINVIATQPNVSNSEPILGWSHTEVALLARGLELFGRSYIRLSQFIGSKSSSEVGQYLKATSLSKKLSSANYSESNTVIETNITNHVDLTEEYNSEYLVSNDMNMIEHESVLKDNFTSEDTGDVVFGDNDIPASMEEVISLVTTAKATINGNTTKKYLTSINANKNRSLLKKSYGNSKLSSKSVLKMTPKVSHVIKIGSHEIVINEDTLINHDANKKNSVTLPTPSRDKTKKEPKVAPPIPSKCKSSNESEKLTHAKNKIKRKSASKYPSKVPKVSFSEVNIKCEIVEACEDVYTNNKSIKSEFGGDNPAVVMGLEIITGTGKSLMMSDNEEMIKLEKKNETDSDIEIDIENDDSNGLPDVKTIKREESTCQDSVIQPSNNGACFESNLIYEDTDMPSDCVEEIVTCVDNLNGHDINKTIAESCDSPKSLSAITSNVESQCKELLNSVTDSDASSLSPELLQQLSSMEVPEQEYKLQVDVITDLEKYVHFEFFEGRPTKTPSRYLKIRSHIMNCWRNIRPNYVTKTFARQGLKQCGDVNCIGRVHTLLEQLGAINFKCEQLRYIRPLSKLMLTNGNQPLAVTSAAPTLSRETFSMTRPRKKIKLGESEGYTISHAGPVDEIVVYSESFNTIKSVPRQHSEKLIKCLQFSDHFQAPFRINISLSSLLCMHMHAISSVNETMGLIGGTVGFDQDNKTVLNIKKYKPCRTVLQTRTHCEMCPVSQSEAVDGLSLQGLTVVGWVHSHPGFPPLPSVQDAQTQKQMQELFFGNGPFVGIITAPHNTTIRCLTIPDMKNDIPYELSMRIICNVNIIQNLDTELKDIINVIKRRTDYSELVDLKDKFTYNKNVTGIDKLLSNTQIIIQQCKNKPNSLLAEKILQSILKAAFEISQHLNRVVDDGK